MSSAPGGINDAGRDIEDSGASSDVRVGAQLRADHGLPESSETVAVGSAELLAGPSGQWRVQDPTGGAHVPRVAAALLERDRPLVDGPNG